MKKTIIITVSIVVGLCIVVGIGLSLHSYMKLSETINYTPINIQKVNYNNYINNAILLDYKDGQIAIVKRNIFSSKLLVKDAGGNTTSYDISTSDMQIQENHIAYINKGVLYLLNTKTDENIQISNDITEFILMDDRLIYVCGTFSKNKVFSYSCLSEESEILAEDVEQILVKDDCVYAVKVKKHDNTIKRIINTETDVQEAEVEVDFYSYKLLPCGDAFVVVNNAGVTITDGKTGERNDVFVSDYYSATSFNHFICNDKKIFLSFEASKANGSFVYTVADEGNGLWMIDPISHETKKISDTVYNRLFLFGDTELVGILNGKAYKIDISTGEAIQIK